MKVWMRIWKLDVLCAQSLQSCPTLCSPVECSLPGSSVCGILQAKILTWVAIPVSSRSSGARDLTHMSCISRQIPYHLNQRTWEGRLIIEGAPALASQEGRHFISFRLFLAVPGLSCSLLDIFFSCGMWYLVPWRGIRPWAPCIGSTES